MLTPVFGKMSRLITSEIHLILLPTLAPSPPPKKKKKNPPPVRTSFICQQIFCPPLSGRRVSSKVPAACLWNGAQPLSVVAADSFKHLAKLAWDIFREALLFRAFASDFHPSIVLKKTPTIKKGPTFITRRCATTDKIKLLQLPVQYLESPCLLFPDWPLPQPYPLSKLNLTPNPTPNQKNNIDK